MAAQELRGVGADDLCKVRCQHRRCIDHSITSIFGMFSHVSADPQRVQSEGRFGGGNSFHLFCYAACIHSQVMVNHQFALCHLDSFDFDYISSWRKLEIVPNTDHGNKQA